MHLKCSLVNQRVGHQKLYEMQKAVWAVRPKCAMHLSSYLDSRSMLALRMATWLISDTVQVPWEWLSGTGAPDCWHGEGCKCSIAGWGVTHKVFMIVTRRCLNRNISIACQRWRSTYTFAIHVTFERPGRPFVFSIDSATVLTVNSIQSFMHKMLRCRLGSLHRTAKVLSKDSGCPEHELEVHISKVERWGPQTKCI